MDAYPEDYIQVNVPLVVLSGLGKGESTDLHPIQQNGFRIFSELPAIVDPRAEVLRKEFIEASASGNGTRSPSWRFRTCGREYWLPCRKASPQATFVETPPLGQSGVQSPSSSLHSPLSPLSPGSPLNPDGLMTPTWLAKHQQVVPAALIACFKLGSDPDTDTLSDNKLKNEIINFKSRLESSNYRIQCVIVLLGEKSVNEAPEMEERLANLRKATKLDSKTSFFTSIRAPDEELKKFASDLLSTIRPPCLSHYSELTKHSRRKRDRGVAAPTTPTGDIHRPLSSHGWRLRYEFKLGFFAEFRSELDVAQRHFVSTLDMLLETGGTLESTSNWSPRWDEARFLADITAIRLIRCYLASGMPTYAVRSWRGHRERIRSVVDGHGKGTSNYGWHAWEANWCKVMSQLLHDCSISDELRENKKIYATPEKLPPGVDRIHPWENLHHPGYWLKLASKISQRRKEAAYDIPEDDRVPPGQSPATRVARRTELYDTYLCSHPHEEYPPSGKGGYDHSKDITSSLRAAAVEFEENSQIRMLNLIRHLQAIQIDDSFELLRTAWRENSWRGSNWNALLRVVAASLHQTAVTKGDVEIQLATLWELLNSDFALVPGLDYNFMSVVEDLTSKGSTDTPILISLREIDVKSFVHIYFAFQDFEGHVGEPLVAEVVLFSNAQAGSAPVTLSAINIEFEGDVPSIDITHIAEAPRVETNDTPGFRSTEVSLRYVSDDNGASFRGSADLTLEPGNFNVMRIQFIVRETGPLVAVAAKTIIKTASLDFQVSCDLTKDHTMALPWRKFRRIAPKQRSTIQAAQIKILPKPPKVNVGVMNARNLYYTNETVHFDIEAENKESEQISAGLEVRILGEAPDAIYMGWKDQDDGSSNFQATTAVNLSLGKIAVDEMLSKTLMLQLPSLPMDLGLDVRVIYRLTSDPDSPVSKASIADITVIRPFEANFEINPRIHEAAWPSFFNAETFLRESSTNDSHEEDEKFKSHGITTRWSLETKITSFASEPLEINEIDLKILRIYGEADCSVSRVLTEKESPTIEPQKQKDATFSLDIAKLELEERRMTGVDAALGITWKRKDTEAKTTFVTTLHVPRLSFPTGEPRVLATKRASTDEMIHIDFTLENPSMHFLTFNLTMEMSDDFAFSGPKLFDVNLVPLSRHTVQYSLMPFTRGTHIQPRLKVVDAYFNKSLQIQAGNGVTAGKDGEIFVWAEEHE